MPVGRSFFGPGGRRSPLRPGKIDFLLRSGVVVENLLSAWQTGDLEFAPRSRCRAVLALVPRSRPGWRWGGLARFLSLETMPWTIADGPYIASSRGDLCL